MRRREFLEATASITVWPLVAVAQQKAVPAIGWLSGTSLADAKENLAAFHEGLGATGHVEGQNLWFEYRWAEGNYDRLPDLAAGLVASNVVLIAASGGDLAARAAKNSTSSIPIVATIAADPVVAGLVASLSRPGGNLTGVSFLIIELHPKRLELLLELVPQARTIGLLVNPNNPNNPTRIRTLRDAARAKGVQLHVMQAGGEGEIDTAFASLLQLGAGGLVVSTDPFIDSRRGQIMMLAARHSIPAIYGFREMAVSGGLISYGPSLTNVYRQLGAYAGRILQGEKPADLPVQQPTKFELVINLKTAATLGLSVPQTLLVRADEVIE